MPAAALIALSAALLAAEPGMRHQNFDRDPGWEAVRSRGTPTKPVITTQDFGYSPTHYAAAAPGGEIGGRIQRATTPASYGLEVRKTLSEKLSASGTFAIRKSTPGGGVFFGFFRAEQPGGGGRPIGSLGLNMDFEHSGGRLAVRLITSGNRSCGTFITPFIPGKFRPTTLRNDGTRYHWTLDYVPDAADGNGRFTFTLRSDAHRADEYTALPDLPAAHLEHARIRFPHVTQFSVDLPPGYKQEGATFDRFGVMNMMKTGGVAEIYFGDLAIDGRPQDLTRDPRWEAVNNRGSFEEKDIVAVQNFGYSPTHEAGGAAAGEIGGAFWRTEKDWGYYADRIGVLTLEQRIEARGKVKLVVGAPDADMALGFFSSADVDVPPPHGRNFLGVKVGGPTRVGHYFNPGFSSASGSRGKVDAGPVLKPGQVYDWSLVYDPAGGGGLGEIRVTLGAESVTLTLKKGQKAESGRFDRFGIFSSYPGGQMVKIFLDDLSYSAGVAAH